MAAVEAYQEARAHCVQQQRGKGGGPCEMGFEVKNTCWSSHKPSSHDPHPPHSPLIHSFLIIYVNIYINHPANERLNLNKALMFKSIV